MSEMSKSKKSEGFEISERSEERNKIPRNFIWCPSDSEGQ